MDRHGEDHHDEHGDRPDDDRDAPASGRAGPPPSAREIKARFSSTSPGWMFLEALSAIERAWLAEMARRVARRHHLDPDDLLQDLQLGLRDCEVLDQGRSAVRSWLTRRAVWLALDALRRAGRRPPTTPLQEGTPEPPVRPPVGLDAEWTVERFREMGLSRDQAQNLLLLCWDIDLPMRDYAEATEQTYAKVRQDRSRGLRKVKDMFGLTADEEAALVAYRRFGTHGAAALRLDLPEDRIRRLVATSELKIARALGRPADPATTEDEDASDVQ